MKLKKNIVIFIIIILAATILFAVDADTTSNAQDYYMRIYLEDGSGNSSLNAEDLNVDDIITIHYYIGPDVESTSISYAAIESFLLYDYEYLEYDSTYGINMHTTSDWACWSSMNVSNLQAYATSKTYLNKTYSEKTLFWTFKFKVIKEIDKEIQIWWESVDGYDAVVIMNDAENILAVRYEPFIIHYNDSLSDEASLENLSISDGILDPVFNTETYSYTVNVDNSVDSITVTPTVTAGINHSNLTVNGQSVTSGQASQVIPLLMGNNSISILVAAENGVSKSTYTIDVVRQAKANLNIMLEVNSSNQVDFSELVIGQTIDVDFYIEPSESVNLALIMALIEYDTDVFDFDYKPGDSMPSAGHIYTKNNWVQYASGLDNAIRIEMEYSDNYDVINSKTKIATYRLTVIGEPLQDSYITYRHSFGDGITDEFSQFTYSYEYNNIFVDAGGIIPSDISTLDDITINHSSLYPDFDVNTGNYEVFVSYAVESIDITPIVTDLNSTIKVNDDPILLGDTYNMPLQVGFNLIEIVVLAQDKLSYSVYWVSVFRQQQGAVIELTTLINGSDEIFTSAISQGDYLEVDIYIEPIYNEIDVKSIGGYIEFDSAFYTLDSTTGYKNLSSQFALTKDQASGRIYFQLDAISSSVLVDQQLHILTLEFYVNVLPIRNTYFSFTQGQGDVILDAFNNVLEYNVNQTAISYDYIENNEATLDNIQLSEGMLSPLFDINTLNYSVNVGYNTTSITLTPTVTPDIKHSSLTINTVPIVSGSESNPISLNVGNNSILITVTAEDRITKGMYEVIVYREAASSVKTLESITVHSNDKTYNAFISDDDYIIDESLDEDATSFTFVPKVSDGHYINPQLTYLYNINNTLYTYNVDSDNHSVEIPIINGENFVLMIRVTAQDGSQANYNLKIHRTESSQASVINVANLDNATIEGLIINSTVIDTKTSKTINVDVSPYANWSLYSDEDCTNVINSKVVSLYSGDNKFYIKVTAQDGVNSNVYELNIFRTLSIGKQVVNVFSPINSVIGTNNNITTVVDNYTANVVIGLEVSYQATWEVYSDSGLSNHISPSVSLAVGNNTFYIKVIAQDETYMVYTMAIARAKREIIIRPHESQYKIYGQQDSIITYDVIGELYQDHPINGVLSRDSGNNVGVYSITQGTINNHNNPEYRIVFESDSYEIKRKPITVTAQTGQSKKYNEPDPVITYNVEQLPYDDILQGMLSRQSGNDVGLYQINQGTINNANNANYDITFVSNQFSIIAHNDNSIINVVSPHESYIEDDTLIGSVSNSTTSIMIDLQVSQYASWSLYANQARTNIISNKTMTLAVGLNNAYISVIAQDGSIKNYDILINRVGSSANDVINIINPENSLIGGSSISSIVPNNVMSLELDLVVSNGAMWRLYKDSLCTVEIGNNIVFLEEGDNVYYIRVTAEDMSTNKTYKLTIEREKISEASIISIIVPTDTDIEEGIITANVDNSIYQLSVDIVVSENASWALYEDEFCTVLIPNAQMVLEYGINTAYIQVVAHDGTNNNIYTLIVDRLQLAYANIESVKSPHNSIIYGNSIISIFNSPVQNLDIFISDNTIVSGNTNDKGNVVDIDVIVSSFATWMAYYDSDCTIAIENNRIELQLGENTVFIKVTAQNGVTFKIYQMNIYRGAANDCELLDLGAGLNSNLSNNTKSIEVNATVSAGASWALYQEEDCINLIEDNIVQLNVGINYAYMKVTAQDGITSQIYRLRFNRAASTLSNIEQVVTPHNMIMYSNNLSARLPYDYDSLQINLKVSPNARWNLYYDEDCTDLVPNNTINLAYGINNAYIKVIAEDNNTSIKYSVELYRDRNSKAEILEIVSISDVSILANNIISYVSNEIRSLSIDLIVSEGASWQLYMDPECSLAVTNNFLESLLPGRNVVYIKVTAQDGSEKIHKMTIIRALSSDTSLSLDKMVGFHDTIVTDTYMVGRVDYKVDKYLIDLVVEDSSAYQLYSDLNCTILIEDHNIDLKIGENTVYAKIIAEDGTTKIYTLTIYRESQSSNNIIIFISSVAGAIVIAVFVLIMIIKKKKIDVVNTGIMSSK